MKVLLSLVAATGVGLVCGLGINPASAKPEPAVTWHHKVSQRLKKLEAEVKSLKSEHDSLKEAHESLVSAVSAVHVEHHKLDERHRATLEWAHKLSEYLEGGCKCGK